MRRPTLQLLFVLLLGTSNYLPAQQSQAIPMIAVPTITARSDDPMIGNLRRALRERGYIEGQNIRIEHRLAHGNVARLPEIVEELIRLKPSVIVAGLGPIVESAEKATKTIPIVMVGWDYDPVAAGYLTTLNRPAGNVTGIYLRADETVGKRLELLKELLPGIHRVAVLYDDLGTRQFALVEPAAKKLGIKISV